MKTPHFHAPPPSLFVGSFDPISLEAFGSSGSGIPEDFVSNYSDISELWICHRSHFGSRYRLGCCSHAGLLLHQFNSCRVQSWAPRKACGLACARIPRKCGIHSISDFTASTWTVHPACFTAGHLLQVWGHLHF